MSANNPNYPSPNDPGLAAARSASPLSLKDDFNLNPSMSSSALQTKITQALVSAVSGGKPFVSFDGVQWPVTGPIVLPSAPLALDGLFALDNFGGAPGNPAWAYPQNNPPLIGGGILQLESGVGGFQLPANGPRVEMRNIAITYNTPYNNTGPAIQAKPPAYGGGFDYGITNGKFENILVFGQDATSYAFDFWNQVGCYWRGLRSWGGAGLRQCVNTTIVQMGNNRGEDCIFIQYIDGPCAPWCFDGQQCPAPIGWNTFTRCQGIFVTPTVQPPGTTPVNLATRTTRIVNGNWESTKFLDSDFEGGLPPQDMPGPGNEVPSQSKLTIPSVSGQVYESPAGMMMELFQDFTLQPLPGVGEFLFIGTVGAGVPEVYVPGADIANTALVPYSSCGQVFGICSDGVFLYVSSHIADQIQRYTLNGTNPTGAVGADVVAATGNGPWGVCVASPSIGELSAALATTAPIAALPAKVFTGTLIAGATVILNDGAGHQQAFVTSAPVAPGAVSIPVNPQTPNFAYPATATNIDWPQLYWTNNADNDIQTAPADGTVAPSTIVAGCSGPRGICTDGVDLWWCNATTGDIGISTITGTGVNQAFIVGGAAPTGIKVQAGQLFWTNYNNGSIGTATTAGGGVNQVLLPAASFVQPEDLALDATYMYVVCFPSVAIGRATLAGGGLNAAWLPSGLSDPTSICTATITSAAAQVTAQIGPSPLTGVGMYYVANEIDPPGTVPGRVLTMKIPVGSGGQYCLSWTNAVPKGSIAQSFPLIPVKDIW